MAASTVSKGKILVASFTAGAAVLVSVLSLAAIRPWGWWTLASAVIILVAGLSIATLILVSEKTDVKVLKNLAITMLWLAGATFVVILLCRAFKGVESPWWPSATAPVPAVVLQPTPAPAPIVVQPAPAPVAPVQQVSVPTSASGLYIIGSGDTLVIALSPGQSATIKFKVDRALFDYSCEDGASIQCNYTEQRVYRRMNEVLIPRHAGEDLELRNITGPGIIKTTIIGR